MSSFTFVPWYAIYSYAIRLQNRCKVVSVATLSAFNLHEPFWIEAQCWVFDSLLQVDFYSCMADEWIYQLIFKEVQGVMAL